MKTHIDDKYMTVTEENGVLSLVWKGETLNFSDEDFKTEALAFAGIVKENQNKKILVDMRNFHYQLTDDLIDWRNKHVIAAYNEVGVEKFAFVSQKPAVKQDNPENTFVTETFPSEDQALNWLNA